MSRFIVILLLLISIPSFSKSFNIKNLGALYILNEGPTKPGALMAEFPAFQNIKKALISTIHNKPNVNSTDEESPTIYKLKLIDEDKNWVDVSLKPYQLLVDSRVYTISDENYNIIVNNIEMRLK
ncbi:MAG: hypothetical protein HWE27_11775 [Gammaproteobacteria bacterium]|nr:hypothetical protein [Gammaproteobacteria bacterium]